jgi:regulatory protein YycI of two-component signal transduction system YycFG
MKDKIKNPKVIFIFVLVFVVILLAFYTFMANRSRQQKEQSINKVDEVLSKDLNLDYPGTPKEVLTYYNTILDCFYNQKCSDEQIKALGEQARKLFDKELQDANEPQAYINRLLIDIEKFKQEDMRIPSVNISSAVNTDNFTQDGYSFARLSCTYNVKDGDTIKPSMIVYLFRQDEGSKWRIFGWDLAENLNIK